MTFQFLTLKFPFIEFVFLFFIFLDAILSIDGFYIIVSMLLPSIVPILFPPVLLIIIFFYFVEEEKRLLYNTLTQKEKIYSLLSSIEKQNKKVQSTEIYRKVPIISSMLYHQQKTMITNNFYIL